MPEPMDGGDDGMAEALDVLLDAAEAVPPAQAAWDLDLLKTALRIARATEAPEDLQRARLAYGALGPESRARMAERIPDATRRERRRADLLSRSGEARAGLATFLAGLVGRAPASRTGATAKARLMRDVAASK
ncbi:hypothetical protein [Azospirillum sp. ST 5-10]|uniref:hypothetical protein n=1 Tax=unclassified Azospirillum TaxID=2630922 RepID=UPI003F4A5186